MPDQQALVLKALEKLESKFDVIDARLNSMDKTMVKQEANLDEHMRRTALAEQRMEHIEQDVKPIKRHVTIVEGILKGFGLVAMIISIAAGLIKIVQFIELIKS